MSEINRTKIFAGRFESLAHIDEFARVFADEAGFNTETVYLIETAVDEACSNIIEHAYEGQENGEIECSLAADDQCLTVILKDRGISFDPTKVKKPDINAALKKRKDHGVGLFMIRKIMDEVHFKTNSTDGNVLTMVKLRV